MMDQDQEIIDTADKWTKEDQAIKRERLRLEAHELGLRHERRKNWIKAFMILGVVAAVLATAAVPALETFNRWRDRVAQEEAMHQEQQRVLQAAKAAAWEMCIETQGLQACTWIEEQALRGCYFRWDSSKTQDCVEKRLTEMKAL